jgi:hypothetical protein
MIMLTTKMVVSVTEGLGDIRKRREIGTVDIYTPDLQEIAAAIVSAKQTSVAEADGLPVYDSAEANFIFSSVYNAVKMAARNKLVNKTIELKEGLSIATTMADLSVEGSRGGNGEGLATLREVKSAFSDWAATLGKSEATQIFIVTMFSNRQALATQSSAVKEKMAKYVEDFATSLNDEQLDRFARPLEVIGTACMATSTVDDAQDF